MTGWVFYRSLLQKSFCELTDELTENDRVSIVTYASGVNTVLDSATGDQKRKIKKAINGLEAGGCTNGEGGITYTDIGENKYVMGIRCPVKAADGDGAYFIYGDYSATAGTAGFKQNVSKVATPAANTYTTADGVQINAPVYYSVN